MTRWQALAVLSAGTLMIIIDQTIVSVALPAIRADLGFSRPGLAWVVNAYVIPFGGLLLLAGRLGDLLGRKRMFVAGMVVFTVASLLCGLAPTAGLLVGARFLQGVGGAMVSGVSLGMVVALFPAPAERARALGVYSFVQASGGSIGSLLGGVLTQTVSWPWIFYLNLPIGAVAVVLARRLGADRGVGRRADGLGGALATAGLMLAVYAIVDQVWLAGVAAVVLLGAFVLRESTAAAPLLPPRTLRGVVGVNAVQALLAAAMFSFLFFVVLYLVSLGYSPLATGLAMVPVSVSIGVVSLLFSARLNVRFGERPVLLTGLASITLGLALIAFAPGAVVVPATVVLGVGFGAAMPALMALGMSTATAADAGLLSGVFNTSQQIGGALGLATLVALTSDYWEAFALSAALVVAAAVVQGLTGSTGGVKAVSRSTPRSRPGGQHDDGATHVS
ncbi:MFS transporter [Actinophytocola sp.]|uniref:MFS transporter n=1 Tax=Actinophytocola sp. TaxID=1872138 RepID=UPI00389ADF25